MSQLTIPKKLEPIVQAFYADSPVTAKKLILQAAEAIYGSSSERGFSHFGRVHDITSDDLENISTLMQGIKPQDTLEAIMAAQVVSSHMLGMRKLSTEHKGDQLFGLKLLKFSMDAMSRLHRKKSGALQNITVNYNYSGLEPQKNEISLEVLERRETCR